MKKQKIKFFSGAKGDYSIAIVAFLLAAFGVIMIYSASSYSAKMYFDDSFYFVKKQIGGLVLGVVSLIFLSKVNYNIFSRYRIVFFVFGLLLLGLVLIPGISISTLGARRWINIFGVSLQASEIAKFCFVFYSACVLCKDANNHQTFFGVLKIIFVGCVYCVLIMLEPNMSVTMLLAFVMVLMLFIGGLRTSRFFILAVPALCLVVGLIMLEPYRLARLSAFLDPWASPLEEGFQLIQSLYCFGNGGLFGVGLFQSRQKFLFLPFAESDFIFSIIGEELGLVGCFVVMFLFAFLIYRCFKVAICCKNRFGCYLASGIACVLAVQVLINIAVVSGSMPPTGLPLPFISSGGTSLAVFLAMMGVVINISKNRNKVNLFLYY